MVFTSVKVNEGATPGVFLTHWDLGGSECTAFDSTGIFHCSVTADQLSVPRWPVPVENLSVPVPDVASRMLSRRAAGAAHQCYRLMEGNHHDLQVILQARSWITCRGRRINSRSTIQISRRRFNPWNKQSTHLLMYSFQCFLQTWSHLLTTTDCIIKNPNFFINLWINNKL